jgi:hypothetical protein
MFLGLLTDASMQLLALIFNLTRSVARAQLAHPPKITGAFEFVLLTLAVPGLHLSKYRNPLCRFHSYTILILVDRHF